MIEQEQTKDVHRAKYFHKLPGQALDENAIIFAVLLVLIVGASYGSYKLTKWLLNRPSASTVQGEPAFDIIDLGSNAEIIDTEVIPLFNCKNPVKYQIDIHRNRKVEHKVNIESQLEGEIGSQVRLYLQGRYGIEDGETEERSYTIHLNATPNSWVEYTVEWHYVWRKGEMTIKHPDGTKSSYPYSVRSGMEFKITKIENKLCDP